MVLLQPPSGGQIPQGFPFPQPPGYPSNPSGPTVPAAMTYPPTNPQRHPYQSATSPRGQPDPSAPTQLTQNPQSQSYPPTPQSLTSSPIINVAVTSVVPTPEPCLMFCPTCNTQVLTHVDKKVTSKSHIIAGILCLICIPLVVIPYVTDCTKNANHYCPVCCTYLGTFYR